MFIYLLRCGGKLWQDVCHFITMKNWKWHRIVSGSLGRLPNGARSLVMSDLHSNFPLHLLGHSRNSRPFKSFQPCSRMHACMRTQRQMRVHTVAPPRVGITLLGSSRIVKSNVFLIHGSWESLDTKSPTFCGLPTEESWRYTHAAILTRDLKTQVAWNIVDSEQEIQDKGYSSCILPLTPLTLLTLAVEREEFVQTCNFYWSLQPPLPMSPLRYIGS